MLYHERERKIKENANFVHIVYLKAKLCNIVGEAYFIDVSIVFCFSFTFKQFEANNQLNKALYNLLYI